jgi:geranylgeranyl pyrophosphate synthase
MGGIAANASPEQMGLLTRYGAAIGLAFQMADDVLDADEDDGDDGPPSYVKLMGIEETQRQARLLLAEALDAVSPLSQPSHLVSLAHFTVDRDH